MRYRAEIDGLRTLAVLPVILFHAGFSLFSGGFVGVDVFFVISGYLITTIILNELDKGSFSILDFYERRARRILPALFAVLLVCIPFAWAWLLPADMHGFSQSLGAVTLFVSNILFWRTSGYFETAAEFKPLLHTWSLAVEEQYYVLFPVFLMLAWRFGRRAIVVMLALVALASLALAQYGVLIKPAATFYLLPTRGWELLIGAFAAFHGTARNKAALPAWLAQAGGLLGLALLAFAIFGFDRETPFPSLYALVPTLGAVLIIVCADAGTLAGKLLGSRVFVGLGLISYSTYLWHQPLFAFARHLSIDEPDKAVFAALGLLSIGLAYLSWRFIETPFRNRQRFGRRQIFSYAAAGSAVFLVFALCGVVTKGFFGRHYDSAVLAIEATKGENGKNAECWDRIARARSLDPACQLGKPEAAKSFSLVGDSHAGALAAELGRAAGQAGMGGFDYTYNSCPPLLGGQAHEQDAVQMVCNRLRDDFFARLAQHRLPNTVVVLQRWTLLMEEDRFNNREGGIEEGTRGVWDAPGYAAVGYRQALQKSYVDSVKAMLAAGYKVILVYPVPEAGWEVPGRLARIYVQRHAIASADASTSYEVFKQRNRHAYAALDAIGEHPNLVRVKPENFLCNTVLPGRCAAQLHGVPLYYDDDHLSNAGARMVVAEVMKTMRTGAAGQHLAGK